MNRLCVVVLLLLGCFETGLAQAEPPFDDLLPQIPESANVVTLIDAERIRTSAVARDQGLVKGTEGDSSDQTIVPRQDVYQVVLAATIRGFRESLVESQTAVFRLRENPSLAGLAAAYRGRLEELGDREYAALPYGAMALSLSDRTLTVMQPINRQRASQAVARSKQTSPAKLSPFIQTAVRRKTVREQILVAMDLANLYSKSTVFLYLQNSKSFASRPVDIQKAAALISSIQGATLALRFTNRIEGEITLEFGSSAELASEWTRDLLLEILSDIIQHGFKTMEEFLTRAQSIIQRRRSRGGTSLELQVRQIMLEEKLVEGRDFESQAKTEGERTPDFIFPSRAAYLDPAFPGDRLRMLAVKSTCKDRWRQVLTEAKRVPQKHLLTLQEGVSENQFQEMQDAGIRLVVPEPLTKKFPATVRPHLVKLTDFIDEVAALQQGLSA
jgi:hypothetical protein